MDDTTLPVSRLLPDCPETPNRPPDAATARTRAATPERFGRYRVIRLIGEGGMGSVYEAEQDHPQRRVALKVIKPGLAGSGLLRRFELEAEALGRLQHPGIAQIYEAGTADAGSGPQPYFAMELISGANLVEYAREYHLNLRRRMEVVSKICDAVHHAHQRGIIHRDLKPGNILVDQAGQPKVLDFGVARVTDSDAQATRQTDMGQLIGTLAYMSPEQVLADPLELDTRSDVYALGVILFELLASRLPYSSNVKRLHEAIHAIREEEPTLLSRVDRAYRGDVETIVSKALEKDKTRRYASAADLASDIRRYLSDEPITARPPSAIYQLRKFALRHRALVSSLLCILVALLAATVISTREAIRASRAEQSALQERDRATAAERSAEVDRDRAVAAEKKTREQRDQTLIQSERADAQAATAAAVNTFLQSDLLAQASADAQASPTTKPDPDLKVRTVLDRASARIGERFTERPAIEAAIRATIGETYSSLGIHPEASEHLQKAYALRVRTSGSSARETLAVARELGVLYRRQGKFAEAEALLANTLALCRRTLSPEDPLTLLTMSGLADVHQNRGSLSKAEPLARTVLDIRLKKQGEQHPDTAAAMHDLAVLYWRAGKYTEAEQYLSKALSARQKTLGPEHPRTLESANSLAILHFERGRYAEAEPLFVNSLEASRRILGGDHPETLSAMMNLGALYWKTGNLAKTKTLWIEALASSRRTLGPDHLTTLILMNNVAELHRARGEFKIAAELYKQAVDTFVRVMGPENPRTIVAMKNLAVVYLDQKRFVEAEGLLEKAADIRIHKLERDHPETANVLTWLGLARIRQRRYDQAEPVLRDGVAIWSKILPEDYRRFQAESLLGASLLGQAKYSEAEDPLVSGYKGLKSREATIPASNRSQVTDAGERVISLYEAWQKVEQLADWRSKLALNTQ
jgi:eukaryotic-like serine/threonine-protein kinase